MSDEEKTDDDDHQANGEESHPNQSDEIHSQGHSAQEEEQEDGQEEGQREGQEEEGEADGQAGVEVAEGADSCCAVQASQQLPPVCHQGVSLVAAAARARSRAH